MFLCHRKAMKIFLISLSFPSWQKQKASDIHVLADYYCNYYQRNEDSQDKFHQWTSTNMRWCLAGKRWWCCTHGLGHRPATYFANPSQKEIGLQHLIPLSVQSPVPSRWLNSCSHTTLPQRRTAYRAVLLEGHLQPKLSQGSKFHLHPSVCCHWRFWMPKTDK